MATNWFGLRGEFDPEPFTYEPSKELRGKVALFLEDGIDRLSDDTLGDRGFWQFLDSQLKRAFGLPAIPRPSHFGQPYQDLVYTGNTQQCIRTVEVVLDCIYEAYRLSARSFDLKPGVDVDLTADRLADGLNNLFRLHMCGYQVIQATGNPALQIARTDSFYMHEATVKEPLRLLNSLELPTAEKQFFAAVREWSEGNYADAITDANSALETAMKFVLGKDSGTASQLIKALLKEGYMPAYLQSSIERLHELFEMLPRLRDEKGDAHGRLSSEELSNHARLAINLSGSFIVFLLEEWARRRTGD